MRHQLAAIIFLLLVTPVAARVYDGYCFDLVYPEIVQVARGNSTTFEITIKNNGPYRILNDVTIKFDGQCTMADYPCKYEYTQPGQVIWNHTVEVELTLPEKLYDDPVKNALYDEARHYQGYRREFIELNSTECQAERTPILIKPLYGDELLAKLDLTEEQEVFMDDSLIYQITLVNSGPEPFNVTMDEEGVSHRRITFDPPTLTIEPGATANVFMTIDTTDMELGRDKARIYVKTNALADIKLLARFKIKAAGVLAQRQFELYGEIGDIDDLFDAKLKNATYNVTDVIALRSRLSNTRNLITNGYLGIAQEELPTLLTDVKALEPIAEPVIEVKPEEVVIVEELPDESRFEETNLSVESFTVFMEQYAWLLVLIVMMFGTAIMYVAYKGFFVPNTKMIKNARYVSDIEARVKIKIKNASMRGLKNVVLIETLPAGFILQSRFTSHDKNIPFTREDTPDGVTCRMDLSVIDPNSSLEIEYVVEKPKVVFGKVKIEPATLNYTFKGKAVVLKSNVPQLGA